MPRRGEFLLLLLCATTASADWLVTRDGSRIETAGPWTVRGSVVVFTSPDGAFSSLRLAEVDLEASAIATERANRPGPSSAGPSPAEPASAEPVLVLTDRDIGRAATAEPSETVSPEPPAPIDSGPVRVISWRQRHTADYDGLEILGTLQNLGGDLVADVGVEVSLRDDRGAVIASREAFLNSKSLAGRATTDFRALFPGVFQLEGEPRFEVRSTELRISVEPESDDRSAP